MDEQRKHAILFAGTILAARQPAEIGDQPCPAREMCMEDAIRNAEPIHQKIDERWSSEAREKPRPLEHKCRQGWPTLIP